MNDRRKETYKILRDNVDALCEVRRRIKDWNRRGWPGAARYDRITAAIEEGELHLSRLYEEIYKNEKDI